MKRLWGPWNKEWEQMRLPIGCGMPMERKWKFSFSFYHFHSLGVYGALVQKLEHLKVLEEMRVKQKLKIWRNFASLKVEILQVTEWISQNLVLQIWIHISELNVALHRFWSMPGVWETFFWLEYILIWLSGDISRMNLFILVCHLVFHYIKLICSL